MPHSFTSNLQSQQAELTSNSTCRLKCLPPVAVCFVCGNNEFIVKVPNEGSFDYKEGDSIKLNWNPDDIRALDI